jgi:glycerate kinase
MTEHDPGQRKLRTVLAFDSWKESVSAIEACHAAERGLARLGPGIQTICCPLSDGGEGFVETLALAAGVTPRTVQVTGPLSEPVSAGIALLDGGTCAVIEAAQPCGLSRVPVSSRNPGRTTTGGLGELMKEAVAMGAREIVVGLGGSATNDAGIGLLSALGYQFLDRDGRVLPAVGDSLALIERIERGQGLEGVRVIAACDVRNPLFGPTGAAQVYAPQKGASAAQVAALDAGLRHFAAVSAAFLGCDHSAEPGAGAAGGLGFALQAFLGAAFRPGAGMAIRLSRLAAHLEGADLCLTGEGRTDYQTAFGKLPAAVAACCRDACVPCVALSGSLGERWRDCYDAGFTSIFSVLQRPVTLAEAIRETPDALADAAESVGRLVLAGQRGRGRTRP